tara:strand:+ start:284 stop:1144 length:861 start_codon:yes stop_codon:yes gene_type:complete
MNSYLDLATLKGPGGLNTTKTDDDTRLRSLLEGVSAEFGRYTGRHFNSVTDTKYLSAVAHIPQRMSLPDDLIAVTTFKDDENRDGTWENTWAATDYVLWPYDADPTGELTIAAPYLAIEVDQRSSGNLESFLVGQQMYELAGRWGYSEKTDTASESKSSTVVTATKTTIKLTAHTDVQIGHTIKMGNEQMYVKGSSSSGIVTVDRAVNGTSGSSHAGSTEIEIYRYPGAISEAVLMQASRLWERRTSGFANQVGFTETGQMTPVTGLDRDVKDMLATYRKAGLGIL